MRGPLSTLAERIILKAREHQVQIGLAESCTGGRLAAALTGIPQASDVFVGSLVAYQDRAKEALLGVRSSLLKEQRTVNASCAEEMALGAQRLFFSQLSLGVTGSCGPTCADPHSTVGEVWIALFLDRSPQISSSTDKTLKVIQSYHFAGDRESIAMQAAEESLRLMLALLEDL
jgi:nicotinamide-nucleotide amidase